MAPESPPPPPSKILWQGTSAWRDIITRQQRRCPARIVEYAPHGGIRLEFADIPHVPEIYVAYAGMKLRQPDPPISPELQKRLEKEWYSDYSEYEE